MRFPLVQYLGKD